MTEGIHRAATDQFERKLTRRRFLQAAGMPGAALGLGGVEPLARTVDASGRQIG